MIREIVEGNKYYKDNIIILNPLVLTDTKTKKKLIIESDEYQIIDFVGDFIIVKNIKSKRIISVLAEMIKEIVQ